jgi:hypothetical protein
MTTASTQTLDPTADDIPTPVRVNAVNYYVLRDPILQSKLRPDIVKLKKRDGTVVQFNLDVFEITKILYKEGKDALKIGKVDILAAARTYLNVSAPTIHQRPSTASISDGSADLASRAVQKLLQLALQLETNRSDNSQDLVDRLTSLTTEMAIPEEIDTPLVVPFAIVSSAAQLADIHPRFSKHKASLAEIIATYQRLANIP